jgi:hypothetical protein
MLIKPAMSRYLDLHAASWMEHHNYHLEIQMGTFSPPAAMTWTTLKGPPSRHGRCRFIKYFSLQELYCRKWGVPNMQFTACHFNGNMAQRKDTWVLFLLCKNSTVPNTCILLACGCPCIICMGPKRGRVSMGGAGGGGGRNSWVRRRGPTSKQVCT